MTYPKDGERKQNETIKQLKREISRLQKENRIMRDALGKSVEFRKESKKRPPVEDDPANDKPEVLSDEEWRKNFSRKYKPKAKT